MLYVINIFPFLQVESSFNESLSDLQLDYLDLYLIHWPIALEPGMGSLFPVVRTGILLKSFEKVYFLVLFI